MRCVLQRVNEASVKVDGSITGEIKTGILILAGFEEADTKEDLEWMCNKICNLRIFNDENDVMNLSLKEISGEVLLVSQFTLHAQTKKGNRPSYSKAAKRDIAIPLYEEFQTLLKNETGKSPACGIFGADMKVSLVNDGPVTIIIDTKNKDF